MFNCRLMSLLDAKMLIQLIFLNSQNAPFYWIESAIISGCQ